MSEPIGVLQVELLGTVFSVWFHNKPDLGLLSDPVNGPEHNQKLAQLLHLLKGKTPESMQDDGDDIVEDREKCRREWLATLKEIEANLGAQLRKQLRKNPGEYLKG